MQMFDFSHAVTGKPKLIGPTEDHINYRPRCIRQWVVKNVPYYKASVVCMRPTDKL